MVNGKSSAGLVGACFGHGWPRDDLSVLLSALAVFHIRTCKFSEPLAISAKLISPYVSIMSSSTSSPSAFPPSISSPSASPSEASKPLDAPTMPVDRSLGRDVFIYDAEDPDKVLGGLILTNGVTNANFYSMVEILIIFGGHFSLLDDSGTKINRDDNPLQPGNYFIDADGRLLVYSL